MPHIIRLRGPWQNEALEDCGAVRYRRNFHQPTGLETGSKVWLVVEGVAGPAEVSLNGRRLGDLAPGAAARFEIRADLQSQNGLEIIVRSPEVRGGGPPGVVRLEIEEGNAEPTRQAGGPTRNAE